MAFEEALRAKMCLKEARTMGWVIIMGKSQRRSAHKTDAKVLFLSESFQVEQYHGGPTCVVGRPAKYRSGRGIARVGDSRNEHGPVRVLLGNGVVAEMADPACCPELGMSE